MNRKFTHILATMLLFVLAFLPLVLGLGYALFYSVGMIGSLGNGFTLDHWKKICESGELLESLVYSIAVSLVSVTCSVLIGYWLAIKFKRFFLNGPLSYFIYLPLAFPSLAAAFFFFQFLSGAGALSRLFFHARLITSPDAFPALTNDGAGLGILITQIFISSPVFVLLYTTLIRSERMAAYQELAASLGATQRQFRVRILAPVLFKKSLPVIILYFIFKLGAYEIPLLLGRSKPQMISVLAITKLQRFNLADIPQGYAIAIIYAVFVFGLLIVMQQTTRAYGK